MHLIVSTIHPNIRWRPFLCLTEGQQNRALFRLASQLKRAFVLPHFTNVIRTKTAFFTFEIKELQFLVAKCRIGFLCLVQCLNIAFDSITLQLSLFFSYGNRNRTIATVILLLLIVTGIFLGRSSFFATAREYETLHRIQIISSNGIEHRYEIIRHGTILYIWNSIATTISKVIEIKTKEFK